MTIVMFVLLFLGLFVTALLISGKVVITDMLLIAVIMFVAYSVTV